MPLRLSEKEYAELLKNSTLEPPKSDPPKKPKSDPLNADSLISLIWWWQLGKLLGFFLFLPLVILNKLLKIANRGD